MIIKYFAWVKDITNKEIEELNETNCNNINELKNYLCTKYPTLRKHMEQDTLRYAINQEYKSGNVTIKKNDEIAIFPPVSGG
tara:strand:- start:520 stop:765 length:246 start_codon:yes stop_codon:yes gene_type:complete